MNLIFDWEGKTRTCKFKIDGFVVEEAQSEFFKNPTQSVTGETSTSTSALFYRLIAVPFCDETYSFELTTTWDSSPTASTGREKNTLARFDESASVAIVAYKK